MAEFQEIIRYKIFTIAGTPITVAMLAVSFIVAVLSLVLARVAERGTARFLRTRKAEEWYHRALEIAPDFSDAEFYLSSMYMFKGEDRKALEQMEKALSKYPDNVWGLWSACDVALFLGRDAQAKGYFEKLTELAPEAEQGRYANIRLGYLLWKAGEKDEA